MFSNFKLNKNKNYLFLLFSASISSNLFFIALMLNSGALTSEDSSSFKEDIQSIKRFFNFIKSDIKTVFKNKKDF